MTPRFNEAPIHESGKWRTGRHDQAGRTRFNEAPIHESGKSPAVTGMYDTCDALQ